MVPSARVASEPSIRRPQARTELARARMISAATPMFAEDGYAATPV